MRGEHEVSTDRDRQGPHPPARLHRGETPANRESSRLVAWLPPRAPPAKPALIGAVIERAVAEIAGGQHFADQNQRGAIDAGLLNLVDDGAERGADDLLVRPTGAKHHGDRAVLAVG